jgi:outer membrane protein assembly factor BamA
MHSLTASVVTEWERPELEGSVAYSYGRLPFDFGASAYRTIAPGGGYRIGNNTIPWAVETVGVTTAVSYAMPRAFDGQSFNLSYSAARVAGELPLSAARLNPYDTPTQPARGMLGTLHLGWSYSNAESYLWSVGAEKGFGLGATFDLADPALASDFSGYAAKFDFSTYVKMPWLRHHVLALHAGGGASGGNQAGIGFYVGGFVDYPVIDTVRNYVVQRGWVVLRGYPVAFQVGPYYGLTNAEYRFPIVNVDRGLSTLPLFLQRITGAAFVDYGSAFYSTATAQFKTGVGGELWFDFIFGYILNLTFRAGYARGLASGGIDKTYFVAVAAF